MGNWHSKIKSVNYIRRTWVATQWLNS